MSKNELFKGGKGPQNVVKKPFLKGKVIDGETWKKAALFFGSLVMMYFVTLIVCSMTGFSQVFLRIAVNLVIVVGILMIFYNNGVNHGSNAVARGEIAWQKQEKGTPLAESEQQLCYQPMKGFVMAAIGTIPVVILGVILALTATKQTATQGTLPSWIQNYLNRSEVGEALTAYTNPKGLSFVELIRIVVRIIVLPFINMVGTASDKTAVLWVERLSPILALLPAAAYGIGFTRGPDVRAQVHTEIAANTKRRIRREKREKRLRLQAAERKGPKQLN